MDAETPREDDADTNREPSASEAPSGWVTTGVATGRIVVAWP